MDKTQARARASFSRERSFFPQRHALERPSAHPWDLCRARTRARRSSGSAQRRGKCTYSDGAVYEGEWQDGAPNGQGKKTHSNGEVCEGEFKDGDALPKRDDDSDTTAGPPAKLEGELAAKRARSEGVE